MASPLGHVIVGVGAAGALAGVLGAAPAPPLWAGAAVAACLPDLDFLPCLWGVRYRRVHRQATHSALILLAFAALCWTGISGLGLPVDWRVAAGWLAALLSHLALDTLCTGPNLGPQDFGIPLCWPLSVRRWYVYRPVVPETNLLEACSFPEVIRAGLHEVLRLGPAACALILLGHLL
jgi:membrane-bound metal-dependent hydrolase YbcI (DUF457 family)